MAWVWGPPSWVGGEAQGGGGHLGLGVGAAILSRGAGSVGVDMLVWGRPSCVVGGGSGRGQTSWIVVRLGWLGVAILG